MNPRLNTQMNTRMTATQSRTYAGFTLVEILVVMAIIGILATIGTSSFLTSRLRGRDSERKNALSQVQRAAELYYNDFNRYPEESELVWGDEFVDAANPSTVYMSVVPEDPRAPDQSYLYEVSADGQRYRLYARLENTLDLATDLDSNGTSGDEFDGTMGDMTTKECGDGLNCNYGISSPSTNMSEAL